MKKIYFDQLNIKNNKIQFFLIVLSGMILLNSLCEFIIFENERLNNWIKIIPYLIITFLLSKMFWFKNIVQWNKKGIVIKLNGSSGKSYKFKEIDNFNVQNEKLEIKKYNGTKSIFELKNIEPKSIENLQNILAQNLNR
ncbi:hypothetical protein [Elizabethkingia sp. JS20170427COW]|uniref:hypothetical protein n=1 Tax=Elizabethkingia sp. JS20170427COW TaxID=2583851 RepID=UPI001110391F|nr:hypothetical protein [Elizabethkingia sp. JS20170427COW]QCX54338.1 hypothetical protein FGE20_11610 [Elizabethkingia sp. JS20170427COW]